MATKETKIIKRVPLYDGYNNRGTDPLKDVRIVNAFPENYESPNGKEVYLVKRPGLVEFSNVVDPGAEGRGLIWFYSHFYTIIGNKVYQVSADGVTKVLKITLTTSTGLCGMIVGNSSSLGDYIFIVDGVEGWIIESDGTATEITDVNFPTPHVPTPTFIDGYILLAKYSDVYNCQVDDPFVWPPEQYIPAEMFPDPVIALARQNNQVVCFGSESTEFFFDNANAAGSPLSRNTAVAVQIGCVAPHALYQNEQFCIFIGQSVSGGRAVWKLDGYTPKKVSTEYIDRLIDAESQLTNVSGYGFRTMGHLFFVFTLPQQDRTLVYDVDEQLWHEWASVLNHPDNVIPIGTTPIYHHAFDYTYAADAGVGKIFLLSATTGDIYVLDPDVYLDEASTIVVELRTDKLDFDIYKRKFVSNLKVIGDRYETENRISLSWSDDDYKTWSTEHIVELTDDFPYLGRLGAFRRRAWRVIHVDPQPLRLAGLELLIAAGIS